MLLPAELQRQVFELAAFLHPECLLELVLVAWRIKEWMQPLLYRTLSIHPRIIQSEFPRLSLGAVAKLSTSQPDALRAHTRHICFVDFRPDDVAPAADFLALCPVTVDLAFIDTPCASPSALTPSTASCGPHLSTATRAIFSEVTHLDIVDWDFAHWSDWSGLAQMLKLTHLSTAHPMSRAVVLGILEHCELLEVLVLRYRAQWRLDEDHKSAVVTEDPRFVMLVVEDHLAEWESGARGGGDYWATASAIVENVDPEGIEDQTRNGKPRHHASPEFFAGDCFTIETDTYLVFLELHQTPFAAKSEFVRRAPTSLRRGEDRRKGGNRNWPTVRRDQLRGSHRAFEERRGIVMHKVSHPVVLEGRRLHWPMAAALSCPNILSRPTEVGRRGGSRIDATQQQKTDCVEAIGVYTVATPKLDSKRRWVTNLHCADVSEESSRLLGEEFGCVSGEDPAAGVLWFPFWLVKVGEQGEKSGG
ncbi:hypothetical protein B0H14DRAFT_2604690 [Mycena olivaceomarginata]|nr:hypothetical protein B0H14DRAFT_2604690 [Mycena olivaceomarginata]